MFKPLLLAAALLVVPAVHACCDKDLADPAHDVRVVEASIVPLPGTAESYVSVLGTLHNTTTQRVSDLVVEAKLLDAAGHVVDVLTEPLAGIVVPANRQVAFRIQERAASPLASYVRVDAHVVSGSTRTPRAPVPETNPFVEFLVAWAPMLALIAAWLFVMRRYLGKNSPQQRMVGFTEAQTALLAKQLAAIERLAAAAQARRPDGGA